VIRIICTARQAGESFMGMDHVSLTVRDVDRSIEFYSKGLGMKLLRKSVVNPTPDSKYINAYMYSDHFLLELITAEESALGQSQPENFPKAMRGSIGITHLGVRVKDLNTAMANIKAAGATMIGDPIEVVKEKVETTYFAEDVDSKLHYVKSPSENPWRVALFTDPDGITIELLER
jgi:catechol 2,3-dioxygenase-like lactoylglutathione lyase family enzyme